MLLKNAEHDTIIFSIDETNIHTSGCIIKKIIVTGCMKKNPRTSSMTMKNVLKL